MSDISTALAKASRPTAKIQRAPFKESYLKSGLFRVCAVSVIIAAPLATLAVRASTPKAVTHIKREQPVVVKAQPTASPDATLGQPKLELTSDFESLRINAIIATDNARVLMGSRIVRVGDDILPGLKLVEIEAEKLVAVDVSGARYVRTF